MDDLICRHVKVLQHGDLHVRSRKAPKFCDRWTAGWRKWDGHVQLTRSKLPAIDFSIRWNLFFKKLNGVTRAQAFHKLRASSCTRKLRASPKSRRKLKQKWMNIQRKGLHNIMGRDEMGDEFRCFLVALFAWYVGPLACKGIVSLSKQDFEWMSWILNGNSPWRQLLRVILTLEDFTHPEFCARFAQAKGFLATMPHRNR